MHRISTSTAWLVPTPGGKGWYQPLPRGDDKVDKMTTLYLSLLGATSLRLSQQEVSAAPTGSGPCGGSLLASVHTTQYINIQLGDLNPQAGMPCHLYQTSHEIPSCHGFVCHTDGLPLCVAPMGDDL